jgi:hypothetical protein
VAIAWSQFPRGHHLISRIEEQNSKVTHLRKEIFTSTLLPNRLEPYIGHFSKNKNEVLVERWVEIN